MRDLRKERAERLMREIDDLQMEFNCIKLAIALSILAVALFAYVSFYLN